MTTETNDFQVLRTKLNQTHTTILREAALQLTQRTLHPELAETLINREMDVLLLTKRLTNKEIAQELGISNETVKRHTINLYRKLNVQNRRQAAAQVRKWGLLTST